MHDNLIWSNGDHHTISASIEENKGLQRYSCNIISNLPQPQVAIVGQMLNKRGNKI